jgi:CHAD domain-containing protein
MANLFRHLPVAMSGDEEALHQLRVWGRRLRVAVRLLAAKPDGRRARRVDRALAQLTRTAGVVRDLDVLLEILDDRLRRLPTRTGEQRRLRRRLSDLRRRRRARMVQTLLDLDIASLRNDLSALVRRACPEIHSIAPRFRALCERQGRKLTEGFTSLGAFLDIGALHGLRRRARRLRYAVEIYAQVFGIDGHPTKHWKTLQDLIGVLQDHHLLSEWFEQQAQAADERGSQAIAICARAEARWARESMQRLHDVFLAAEPMALVRRGLAATGQTPTIRPP